MVKTTTDTKVSKEKKTPKTAKQKKPAEEINKKGFFKRLSDVQAKNITIPRNGKVSYSRKDKFGKYTQVNVQYATLDDILSEYKKPLSDSGLVTYSHTNLEKGIVTTYVQDTESDDFIKSDFYLKSDKYGSAQGYGAWITYGKRYNIGALLSIATDEDIDGPGVPEEKDQASNSNKATPPSRKAKQTTQPEVEIKLVSEKQKEYINSLYKEYLEEKGTEAKPIQEIIGAFKNHKTNEQMKSTSEMTSSQASTFIESIKKQLD